MCKHQTDTENPGIIANPLKATPKVSEQDKVMLLKFDTELKK